MYEILDNILKKAWDNPFHILFPSTNYKSWEDIEYQLSDQHINSGTLGFIKAFTIYARNRGGNYSDFLKIKFMDTIQSNSELFSRQLFQKLTNVVQQGYKSALKSAKIDIIV